jgi:hypothetical protein
MGARIRRSADVVVHRAGRNVIRTLTVVTGDPMVSKYKQKALLVFAFAAVLNSTGARAQQSNTELDRQFAIIRDENADTDARLAAIDVVLPSLQQGSPRQRITWAALQGQKGFLLQSTSSGSREQNLENAISALEAALTVFGPGDFPEPWARTQNNLGITYRNRIRGDNIDNVVKAIAAYEAALTVYTPERYPQQNAETLNNLRIARRALDQRLPQ